MLEHPAIGTETSVWLCVSEFKQHQKGPDCLFAIEVRLVSFTDDECFCTCVCLCVSVVSESGGLRLNIFQQT